MGELSLSNLIKVAIESPDKLSDEDVEEVVGVWNRNFIKINFIKIGEESQGGQLGFKGGALAPHCTPLNET